MWVFRPSTYEIKKNVFSQLVVLAGNQYGQNEIHIHSMNRQTITNFQGV